MKSKAPKDAPPTATRSRPAAKTPRAGQPVRGSRTGRPIMAALDLLGRRGALRVVWELRNGALTFRALQDAAETNPALLNTRLKELRESRLVDHDGSGYLLTAYGTKLLTAIAPLQGWAEAWARGTDDPAS